MAYWFTALARGLALCGAMASAAPADGDPAPFMMRAVVDDQFIEGQPLAWTNSQMLLLGREGVLYEFDPAAAKEAEKFGSGFVPYSAGEVATLLRGEFDRSFEVSHTAHFVVVHPRGAGRAWADRLESLYRSFTHYVGVRGFRTREPMAPLVAVVFRNQDDYFRYAAAKGTQLRPGTLGHYDPTSNRVFLFDASENSGGADWAENAATIIHEATHQAAYNVGVHRRFAEQPRWLVEGLAMMFEARGVWDASNAPAREARINRDRLEYFRSTASSRPADWIARIVASDGPFRSDALNAYAEAWTLTFYLCEARPQEYCAFLARTADRKPFSNYPATERVAEFSASFGADWTLLGAQLQRFVDGMQ